MLHEIIHILDTKKKKKNLLLNTIAMRAYAKERRCGEKLDC